MKWYSVELTRAEYEYLKPFLSGHQYEPSQCGELVHLEVYCTEKQADGLNAIIDCYSAD